MEKNFVKEWKRAKGLGKRQFDEKEWEFTAEEKK